MICRKTGISFWIVGFILLAISGPLQAQKVPGVEKDKVYIGTSMPFSGPAASWGTVGKAMEAYFKYVNQKGGVHGREIILLARDDGYTPARMKSNIEELADKVLFFAGLMGTANLSANRDLIAEKKIPTVVPLANVRMWMNYPKDKLKYFFVAYTDYQDEASHLTKFAIEKLGSQKIAVFYQNDDYGETGLKGAEIAGGNKIVAKVSHELAEVDFSVHAQKIKDAGADTILIYSNPRQTAAFVKKLAEIGVKPKILASYPLSDPIMVRLAGELWDGAYVGAVVKLPTLYPDAQKIFEEVVKIDPELAKTPMLTTYGIMIGAIVEDILRRAGKDLTREKIIKTLEETKNLETFVSFPINWSKDKRHGSNYIGIWRVYKDGRYEEIDKPKALPLLF
ncbi:MAG: ABC transporter substrate-binding protein [Candidatus Calescibacterium sp.]|nr:ABC transporter substrate-binding protein [Candidatus Calescibacterium sp.]MCX7734696.1 ABC transporter substrate-binding protein [bacterium]MDW8087568.1 ABC transporter substrate-binding protein [Candidatus Calescibacterium sp.]